MRKEVKYSPIVIVKLWKYAAAATGTAAVEVNNMVIYDAKTPEGRDFPPAPRTDVHNSEVRTRQMTEEEQKAYGPAAEKKPFWYKQNIDQVLDRLWETPAEKRKAKKPIKAAKVRSYRPEEERIEIVNEQQMLYEELYARVEEEGVSLNLLSRATGIPVTWITKSGHVRKPEIISKVEEILADDSVFEAAKKEQVKHKKEKQSQKRLFREQLRRGMAEKGWTIDDAVEIIGIDRHIFTRHVNEGLLPTKREYVEKYVEYFPETAALLADRL